MRSDRIVHTSLISNKNIPTLAKCLIEVVVSLNN